MQNVKTIRHSDQTGTAAATDEDSVASITLTGTGAGKPIADRVGQSFFITYVAGSFAAAVTAEKALTLKAISPGPTGGTTDSVTDMILVWNMPLGTQFSQSFTSPIPLKRNADAVLELDAGGVTNAVGRVDLLGYLI